MSSRVWVGSAVAAAAIAMATLAALLISSVPWHDDALFVFGGLAPALVGAVIAVRKPDNTIAKLLVVIGAAWLLGEASRIYLWMSIHIDVQTIDLAAWFVTWVAIPAWVLVPVLVAVFPSGRVTAGWLRVTLGVYLGLMTAVMVVSSFVAPNHGDAYDGQLAGIENPLMLDSLSSVQDSPVGSVLTFFDVVSGFLVVLVAAAVVVDLVIRWRRSTGVESRQMRTFALGVFVMIVLLVFSTVMLSFGDNRGLENLGTVMAISAPPLAIGVAVLRYRLYQIDRLISRTVSYALVAGSLAAIFSTIAVVLPQMLGVGEQSQLAVAGATLAVAASFNPLRRRIQMAVDHRFDRARYDAQREVDLFSDRLQALVDVDDVTAAMLTVVAETMRPTGVSVWVAGESDRTG